MQDRYYALSVDLQKSRSYSPKERNDAQDRLEKCLDFLNGLYASQLAVKISFSGGDEVQGLFKNPGAAFLCYRSLLIFMQPYLVRGGIGRGGWDVRVEGAPSPAQDGAAFHAARKAINDAKKDRHYDFHVVSGIEGIDRSLTVSAGYPLGICLGRTSNQKMHAAVVEICRPLCCGKDDAFDYCAVDGARRALFESLLPGKRMDRLPEGLFESTLVDLSELAPGYPDDSLKGLSYKLNEIGPPFKRVNVDRAINGGGIVQERNAAVFSARFIERILRW